MKATFDMWGAVVVNKSCKQQSNQWNQSNHTGILKSNQQQQRQSDYSSSTAVSSHCCWNLLLLDQCETLLLSAAALQQSEFWLVRDCCRRRTFWQLYRFPAAFLGTEQCFVATKWFESGIPLIPVTLIQTDFTIIGNSYSYLINLSEII